MERILECVPNFSEGRDMTAVEAIAGAIGSVEGVKILDKSSGAAANRTVITFAGAPEAVCEAAFRGAQKASEVIDMRKQSGTHPRLGATDVLPLVPVSGITMEESAAMARALARRMWEELGNPCYCYEAAAFIPERKKLETCRSGEYEGLPGKLSDPALKPDFGPASFHEDPSLRTPRERREWETISRCGASNVGARKFLIAVNFNLDSKDRSLAMEIARDVRESGRLAPDGTRVPGVLRGCKAIGWYIDEYGIAQVSMNITDMDLTPLHLAYTEVCKAAAERGLKVTGTEIIGLLPLRALTEAGQYFMKKKGLPGNAGEDGLIEEAVEDMNLNDLSTFDPDLRILERRI